MVKSKHQKKIPDLGKPVIGWRKHQEKENTGERFRRGKVRALPLKKKKGGWKQDD